MGDKSVWPTVWEFACACTLAALAVLALAMLIGGCAPAAKLVQVPVQVPLLVSPNCEVRNCFEMCKEKCLRSCEGQQCNKNGLRPDEAWEDAQHCECHCVPFDASLMR